MLNFSLNITYHAFEDNPPVLPIEESILLWQGEIRLRRDFNVPNLNNLVKALFVNWNCPILDSPIDYKHRVTGCTVHPITSINPDAREIFDGHVHLTHFQCLISIQAIEFTDAELLVLIPMIEDYFKENRKSIGETLGKNYICDDIVFPQLGEAQIRYSEIIKRKEIMSLQRQEASREYQNFQQTLKIADREKDHEGVFFERIKPHSSKRSVIQFGSKTDSDIVSLAQDRKVIVYDSLSSKDALTRKEVVAREINLDDTKNLEDFAFQKILKEDLRVSVDILLIRILEHLNSEAAKLLLFTLMNVAAPGTTFYIESSKPSQDSRETSLTSAMHFSGKFLGSFFAARTDMQFLSHHIKSENSINIEQLIVQKI